MGRPLPPDAPPLVAGEKKIHRIRKPPATMTKSSDGMEIVESGSAIWAVSSRASAPPDGGVYNVLLMADVVISARRCST